MYISVGYPNITIFAFRTKRREMILHIKDKLDELVDRHNTSAFIEKDPIQFPRRYSRLPDIEIAAFLTATISWGNRASILKSADRMLRVMGDSPYYFIMNEEYKQLGSKNIHRTFFEHDLSYMCRGLRYIYGRHSSLEDIFSDRDTTWEGIIAFRRMIAIANGEANSKHISNPQAGSACKRLHMALRWLVRQDGIVDLGVWKNIRPSELYIPLDTHVARVSRELGILRRKSGDRKAVEELSAFLSSLRPDDPVIYDFALFGTGEENKS